MIEENGSPTTVVEGTSEGEPAEKTETLVDPASFELDFTPNFANLRKNKKTANLKWKDICFDIGEKRILDNVNGHVDAGEVCALIGPSGAGKSSLLNLLAGRIKRTRKKRISGSFLVNGEEVSPRTYKRSVAYVLQTDALFATATVREALRFSADLRLPPDTSTEEKETLVDELLASLGLLKCADTYCGSELVRGISGGEKKRAAIGVELVTNPSVLFLDEPTSGLDSFSALKCVHILKALAKTGCAILCTIHQPSSEVFALFDSAMLLSNGKVAYNGSLQSLPSRFERAGYPIPPLTNPADFVMMLVQTKDVGCLYNVDRKEEGRVDSSSGHAPENKTWGDDNGADSLVSVSASTLRQAKALGVREWKNVFRDTNSLIAKFAITIFLNVLFAIVFYQVGDQSREDYTIQSHFGAIVNLLISGMFGAAQQPLLTMPLERVVFIREYSTGSYNSFPYLLSKLSVELPMEFITSLLVFIITYWLQSLNGNFIQLVATYYLLSVSSASYAYVIGALAPDAKTAQDIVPIIFVPQILFAGFFIDINQIPAALRWVQYLCTLKFAVNLGLIVEFAEDCTSNFTEACEDLLDRNDIDPDIPWVYAGILIAIFAIFRTLALLALIWRANSFST